MSFRTFRDSAGQEWQVYAVEPRGDDEERRAGERRSGAMEIEEAPVDRRGLDRRVSVGPVHAKRVLGAWLCFEHEGDKRRLTPIPAEWQKASDAQLEEWRVQARPARVRAGQSSKSGSDSGV
jgi:hypothetical protein